MSCQMSFTKVRVDNEIFELNARYNDIQFIGRGAYGAVVSAYDNIHQQNVAIKKVNDIFSNITRAKRILREIKLLRHLNGHENIIQVYNVATNHVSRESSTTAENEKDDSNSVLEFTDVYIVTSLFETDLDAIIGSDQELSKRHVQFFLYQILRALKFIHSAGVIHRDIKPSNVLINSNCDIALCDFGLARGTAKQSYNTCMINGDVACDSDPNLLDTCMTEYVVTRYYRAPELLCETSNYNASVDMWSVGCIFAELLSRKPFFQGKSPLQQLKLIIETLDCPSSENLDFVHHDVTRRIIDEVLKKKMTEGVSKSLLDYFPGVDRKGLDLLSKMLVVQPSGRISAEEALKHPFLRQLHKRMNEPVCDSIFSNEFEKVTDVSMKTVKEMMVEEINILNAMETQSTNK